MGTQAEGLEGLGFRVYTYERFRKVQNESIGIYFKVQKLNPKPCKPHLSCLGGRSSL